MTSSTTPTSSLDVARDVLAPGDGRRLELLGVGRGAPAFLVPPDPAVAASICTAYNGLRPRRRRAERRAVALAMRFGAGSRLSEPVTLDGPAGFGAPPDRALLDELGDRLGRPVVAGIGLGRLDAYWKPVLQLFDHDGRPTAYAKVGWNPVTRELVRTEAQALEDVAAKVPGVAVPRLLHRFGWGDLLVAVTAPLPADSRRIEQADPPPPPPAVERVDGTPRHGELAGTTWWAEVVESVAAGAPGTGEAELPSVLARCGERLGGAEVVLGRQHGDWVPWNLGHSRSFGGMVAWDWEYSSPWAPLGVDLIHGRYQAARLLRGATDAQAFAEAHRERPDHLRLAHAAMIASRRCWATSLGVADPRGAEELSAAAGVLRDLAGSAP